MKGKSEKKSEESTKMRGKRGRKNRGVVDGRRKEKKGTGEGERGGMWRGRKGREKGEKERERASRG